MKPPLRVLVVEDNAGDARLLREMFSKERDGSFEVTHLLRMGEALAHLATNEVDIVLLDMGLPDGHGLDTVRRTRAVAPSIPVIVLTGLDDEALAAQAMKEGAQDYLIKGQIENRALPRALRHAIERHRMQAETDLIRTHQLQFKDEFLSHVSHELRSPLNAIYQFVTILRDKLAGEINEDQQQYLDIVLRNVKQLQAMIDDLLEVTRVQAGKLTIELQCTSVADAIVDAVNTLQGAATAKGIVLSVEIDKQLPLVCADPTRIRQILIILLDNAIKFTPASGAVTVQARMLEDNSNLLVFRVSDTGSGIAAGMTERIFERLFQASDPASAGRQGLGLGLYICKELVTLQGGQIWAQSTPGHGAVLSVTLPIFSLSSLIAPAFRKARRTQSALTLVVSQIGSQTGWLSDEGRAQHTHGVRDLLQRCLLSNLDVLLPKMGSAGAAELFFIVAMTDALGAESLIKRIRQQFEDSETIQQAGLTLSTSYQSLASTERDAVDAIEVSLERVATNIQELVNEEFSSRMVANG
jgi:signal transduction histidine kinase